MRRIVVLATVVAISLAKPELYREKEDFQYSRSSSDEGTKAGFYDAQRGNMGGNYERAHNMDALAQHQMGGLVSQVHGELGDASKAKSGNIVAASNSRGMYGSGHYDLSNVQGRNFHEGVAYDDSSSALSSAYGHSSALHNSAYASNTKNSKYNAGQTGRYSSLAGDADYRDTGNYFNNYDTASGYNSQSGYNARSGYNAQSAYQRQSSANQHLANDQASNIKATLISTRPMRVVVRPGGTVAIPLAAQTYDATHRHTGSLYDQHSFNNEAEDLNSIDSTQGIGIVNPTGKAKHYESSYSYKKEWEKHDTQPVAVPLGIQTENPLANELHMSGGLNSESHHNRASGYHAAHTSQNSYNTKSSQALHQSAYNAEQHGSNSNAYNQGFDTEKANHDALVATLGQNKPKSYQSSYSYHKSWERQGDPYVIVPTSSHSNNVKQRLTDASHTSHHYGSQNHNSYQMNEDCDCDEDQGHIRVVRSYNQQFNQRSQNVEDFGQQTQNLDDLGQQTQNKWENIEDLGQQTQQQWGNLENFEQRQNVGQETQNQWSNLGQETQSQLGDLQDLGQQNQNQWGNLHDLGQISQNNWGSLQGQQPQVSGKLERYRRDNRQKMKELGEKTHKDWEDFRAKGNWENAPALREQTDKEWHDAKEKLWGNNSHNHNNEGHQHHHHDHNKDTNH